MLAVVIITMIVWGSQKGFLKEVIKRMGESKLGEAGSGMCKGPEAGEIAVQSGKYKKARVPVVQADDEGEGLNKVREVGRGQ